MQYVALLRGIGPSNPNYLVVTFFKDHRAEICTTIDLGATDGPTLMRSLDKTHGKAITTRTWKTINRIFTKMSKPKGDTNAVS